MHRLAAEPDSRAVRSPGFRLEVDVVERVVLTVEARGRLGPDGLPRSKVLVEQSAALPELDAERLVLLFVPAHCRLHDEPTLGEDVERAELARKYERMPQRRDDCAGSESHSRRRSGDRRQEDQGRRPRHRRVLVPRHRVVARVAHHAVGAGTRAEDDVLTHHRRVEASLLRDDGQLD